VEENHTVDNLCLELSTLKFAWNLDFHDLRSESLIFMLGLVSPPEKTVKSIFDRWGPALRKFVSDSDQDDQVDLLLSLEVCLLFSSIVNINLLFFYQELLYLIGFSI
jgi:hypothetical protein